MRNSIRLHADHTYYKPRKYERGHLYARQLFLEGERIGHSWDQSPPRGGYGGRTRPMNLPSTVTMGSNSEPALLSCSFPSRKLYHGHSSIYCTLYFQYKLKFRKMIVKESSEVYLTRCTSIIASTAIDPPII